MNDTLIFLVLAGIALIFKWLTSQASGESNKPEPPAPNEPVKRAPPQSEEERVRRFLEALGQPPGSHPPPPVRPRTTVEHRTVVPRKPPKIRRGWAQPLPPLVTTPEEVPRPPLPPLVTAAVEKQRTIPRRTESVVPSTVPIPITPLHPALSPQKSQTLLSLGKMLRTCEGLRQVVLLREILGPPRGLEALGQSHPA
jgi:hypothetical protein